MSRTAEIAASAIAWIGCRATVITDYASQIEGIMEPAMDNVLTGKAPPESLTEANNQVNQLFG